MNAGAINAVAPPAPARSPPWAYSGGGGPNLLSNQGVSTVILTATTFYISEILKEIIDATPAAGPMTTARLGLTVGNLRATRALVVGDIQEPTFPGYAPVVLDPTKWDAPAVQNDGSVTVVNSTPCEFRMTDDTAPATISGLYIASGAAPDDEILATAVLDQPYALVSHTQALRVIPVVGLPAGLTLGSPALLG